MKTQKIPMPELSFYWDWVQIGNNIVVIFELVDGRLKRDVIKNALFVDIVESTETELTLTYTPL